MGLKPPSDNFVTVPVKQGVKDFSSGEVYVSSSVQASTPTTLLIEQDMA